MTITLSNEPIAMSESTTAKLGVTPIAKKALEISRLQYADLVVIETRTNRYEFTVIDPVMREGILSGGVLKANYISVKWAGTVIKSAVSDCFDHKILSCGGRAIFHVVNGRYPENFLVTSPIVRLFLQRKPVTDW